MSLDKNNCKRVSLQANNVKPIFLLYVRFWPWQLSISDNPLHLGCRITVVFLTTHRISDAASWMHFGLGAFQKEFLKMGKFNVQENFEKKRQIVCNMDIENRHVRSLEVKRPFLNSAPQFAAI